LTNAAYPNLVPEGSKVQAIGTNTVLVTYNWQPGTDRYRKIENFVDGLFSNFDRLKKPPHHPGWKDVNPAGTIPGWQRFPAAQQWLDRQAATARTTSPAGIDLKQARAQAARAAPNDQAEQERLFKEFLEWSRTQGRR
jgi:hypothetical protein